MVAISLAIVGFVLALPSQESLRSGPTQPAMTIRRTGGFAGLDEQVSLFSDGKVIDEIGRVRRIPPDDINRFTFSIEKIGEPTTNEIAFPSQLCTDCYIYLISIRKADAIRRFVVEEPIQRASEKESEDGRTVREFLSRAFR